MAACREIKLNTENLIVLLTGIAVETQMKQRKHEMFKTKSSLPEWELLLVPKFGLRSHIRQSVS